MEHIKAIALSVMKHIRTAISSAFSPAVGVGNLMKLRTNKRPDRLHSSQNSLPDDIAEFCIQGLHHYSQGSYEKAITRFNQALRIDPLNTFAKWYIRKSKSAAKNKIQN